MGCSQIAEVIFNQRCGDEHRSFSAGTWVRNKEGVSMHGQKLQELKAAKEVISSLHEMGVDVSENRRDQVDEEMTETADLVVVMAEEHTIPEFLKKSPKVLGGERSKRYESRRYK